MTDQDRKNLTAANDRLRLMRSELSSYKLLVSEIKRALELEESFITPEKRIAWLLHQFDKGRLNEIVQQIEERRHHVKEHQP